MTSRDAVLCQEIAPRPPEGLAVLCWSRRRVSTGRFPATSGSVNKRKRAARSGPSVLQLVRGYHNSFKLNCVCRAFPTMLVICPAVAFAVA
jgi:hypothetical protein